MTAYEITVNGTKYVVEVGDVSSSPVEVVVNGESKAVEFREAERVNLIPTPGSGAPPPPTKPEPELEPAPRSAPPGSVVGHVVTAPMPGRILSILVRDGDSIVEGKTVCTLEAMKMEMPISSTASGTVQAVHVNVGDNVAYDDPLVTVG